MYGPACVARWVNKAIEPLTDLDISSTACRCWSIPQIGRPIAAGAPAGCGWRHHGMEEQGDHLAQAPANGPHAMDGAVLPLDRTTALPASAGRYPEGLPDTVRSSPLGPAFLSVPARLHLPPVRPRVALTGFTVTDVREGIVLIPVVARAVPEERLRLGSFEDLTIPTKSGAAIPVAQVARVH